MKRLALVSSRFLGWVEGQPYAEQYGRSQDRERLIKHLSGLKAKHEGLEVMTMSCDICFGRQIWSVCGMLEIPCVEVQLRYNEYVRTPNKEMYLLSRHAALLDVCDLVHVFVTQKRGSGIEELVQRLEMKVYGRPIQWTVYDPDWKVLKSNA